MSSQNNIIPKDCSYGCNTRIYWNTAENAYFEVFTKQKHICKNRSNNNTTTTSKPNYYNKKPWSTTPKPKMSNSFELLQGPIAEIQKKYEILSDIVIVEYNGRIHGSQRDRDPNKPGLPFDLLVYYEVPEGKRDEVKQKFNTITRNNQVLMVK